MVGKELKHFKIEKLLGKGGMGVVYRARDVRLDRPVALKVLRADLTADSDRRRRFLQEAKAASAVTHPAIAQIYDVDEVSGTTFIAMEFVEGKTVSQLIDKRELDLIGSVEIALQVTE
ncbi:MAG: protein kinase, partial [Candidatus Aminicenantes bacterium]|nr:protein kinase [Candidatus Aminicenantes bacterium]